MADDSIPEEWRPVEGWPYEVSSYGRVRRAIDSPRRPGTTPGYVLKPAANKRGYLSVGLRDRRGERYTINVHRLVAAAFLEPRPVGRYEVAHNDGDPGNNNARNLRWATRSDNMADCVLHGTVVRGTRVHNSKLNENIVRSIRERHANGEQQRAIAASLSVTPGLVNQVVLRHVWKWVP